MANIESVLPFPLWVVARLVLVCSWLPLVIGVPHFGVLAWLTTGALLGVLARRKGLNPWMWGTLGGLFWGVALVVLAFKKMPTQAEPASDS